MVDPCGPNGAGRAGATYRKESTMGALYRRMEEDLKLKNYAPGTRQQYLACAKRFVAYHMRSPEEMGEREIRDFLLGLSFEHASAESLKMHVAALKFLYGTTLRRPEEIVALPWPKVPHRLPEILSGTEVDALLGAVEPLLHRAVVMTAYGTGLRIREACSLRVDDIDSKRKLIHVREGKRGRDRYVMLPDRLRDFLRLYWRQVRPSGPYLFPGAKPGRPITPSAVRDALAKGIRKAGIKKRVTMHGLRHSFATHLLEGGTDIRVIQTLLGHASIRSTMRYTRVTTKHVGRVGSPLDILGTDKARVLG
jgi:site-specific recombinase XerD